jgi:hypothetical protein
MMKMRYRTYGKQRKRKKRRRLEGRERMDNTEMRKKITVMKNKRRLLTDTLGLNGVNERKDIKMIMQFCVMGNKVDVVQEGLTYHALILLTWAFVQTQEETTGHGVVAKHSRFCT